MATNNAANYDPTQYNVQTGGASGALNNVAPSATSGVPVISQGSSSQPVFGTAVVAGGGTGLTSATAYAVVCGGTTSTGPLQSIASVGSAGQVLTSNGGAALPTFQNAGANAFSSINIQTFTGSGTYTPTSGMLYCIIECVGGGGGGGGAASTGATTVSAGGGGGSGGYARKFESAATIGASQTVTVGAAGTAGANTGGGGGSGGSSSVGSLCVATGGTGGNGGAAAAISANNGGNPGSGTTGDVQTTGNPGGWSLGIGAAGFGFSNQGPGGASVFGGSGFSSVNTGGAAGSSGFIGGGGSGGANGNSQASGVTGGAGGAGIVVITEFI